MLPLTGSFKMMSFAQNASSSVALSDVSAYLTDPVMVIVGFDSPCPSGTPSVYWPRNVEPPMIVIAPVLKIAPLGPMTPGGCWPLGTPVYEAIVTCDASCTTVVFAFRSMLTYSVTPLIVSLSVSVFAKGSPVEVSVTGPTMNNPVVIRHVAVQPPVTALPSMYRPPAVGNVGAVVGCGLPSNAAYSTPL